MLFKSQGQKRFGSASYLLFEDVVHQDWLLTLPHTVSDGLRLQRRHQPYHPPPFLYLTLQLPSQTTMASTIGNLPIDAGSNKHRLDILLKISQSFVVIIVTRRSCSIDGDLAWPFSGFHGFGGEMLDLVDVVLSDETALATVIVVEVGKSADSDEEDGPVARR